MAEKTSYFYVLYCADDSLYGGYTVDLKRRQEEHNSGKGAKYTSLKQRRPVQMIYAEAFKTRSEATRAEYAFKQLSRPEKERFLALHQIHKPYGKIKKPLIYQKSEEAKGADSKE